VGENYDFPADIEAAQARLVELQTESQDRQRDLALKVIEDEDGVPLRGREYDLARRRLVDEWNEVNVELRGLKLHIRSLRHAVKMASPERNEGRPRVGVLVDRLIAVHVAGGDTGPLLDEIAAQWVSR
jgi:hypothetical protein